MGYFGYKFVEKTLEVDATRRSMSDWHANVAQLSQLLSVLAITFGKFTLPIVFNFLQNGNLLDRGLAANRVSIEISRSKSKAIVWNLTIRDIESVLGKEVIKGYGTYSQWFFGSAWAAWLGFLCIKDTGSGE
jgi:hypothetical protein